MIIKPLREYVLLEEIEQEETKSGILLTEDADIEKPNLAKVLSIGGGQIESITTSNLFFTFKEGDTVLFKRHLFDEVVLDDKKYLIGKDEGIVAVIENA